MTKKKSNKRGKPTPKPKKASKRGKKVVSKKRKPNPYNQIRSATSAYCREKYGKPCPNTKLNAIYRDLKKKYKKVPIERVIERVETYIDGLEQSVAPELIAPTETGLGGGLEWFYLEDLVANKNLKYFKPKDKFTFDLGLVNEGKLNTTFKSFPKFYRDKIYPLLNEKKGLRESPIPVFRLDAAKTDPNSRKFVWQLEGNVAEEDTIKPKVIEQKGVAARSSQDLERIERIQSRGQEELDRLKWEFENKLISAKEYSKQAKNIRNKFFNKGGKI